MACGCSGGNAATHSSGFSAPAQARTEFAPGTHYEDYVMATFLPEQGTPRPPSGREYPFMLRGEQWWVHPDDVAARPNWWRLVNVPELA